MEKFDKTFKWTEKMPQIGAKGDLFQDKCFIIAHEEKKYKTLEFLLSVSYDCPFYYLKVKGIKGTELMCGDVDLEFHIGEGVNIFSIFQNQSPKIFRI